MTSYSDWKRIADELFVHLRDAIGTTSDAQFKITDALIETKKFPVFGEVTDARLVLLPVDDVRQSITTTQDDVGYGVGIIIAQKSNRDIGERDSTTAFDRILYWRERAIDAISERRLNESGVWRVAIEPRVVVDESAFRNMCDMTSFVARCYKRKAIRS